MCDMAAVNSHDRGGTLVSLVASVVAVILAWIITCPTALAQPHTPPPAGKATDAPADKKAAAAAPDTAKAAPAPAAEAKYTEDPVNEKLKADQFKVQAILADSQGQFGAAGNQQMFEDFYRNYALPRWSQEKNLSQLTGLRKGLRDSLAKAKPGPVRESLNAMVLEYMQKVCAGHYLPAVQYNAMAMIGELNKEEPSGGGTVTPLPAASEVLIAAIKNPKTPEHIRVAAMVGILRHAAAGISDEDAKAALSNAAMKLVAAADPPPATATKTDEWLSIQAVELLGYLRSVGQRNAIYNALIKTLADNKLSLSIRSAAARSLGRLGYAGANGINPAEAAGALAQLVIDACDDVSARSSPTGKPLLLRGRIRQSLGNVLMALTGADDGAGKGGILSLARRQSARVDRETAKTDRESGGLAG